MRKIAELIVKYRKILMVVFVAAAFACLFTISKVNVINELTDYLPEDTETRQGVDLMDEEFTTLGTAKVMINNISYQEARRLAEELETIKGVSGVSFYEEDDEEEAEIADGEELRDVYHELAALITITFETEEEDDVAQYAIADVREMLEGYDAYFYTTVDKDDSATLQEEMQVILVIALVIIVIVLLFTSRSYMEVVIFMMVFIMAAVLNMGTNFIFGDISFVSNAVGTVLQLALGIDYSIIMLHRFMEEREKVSDEEAMIRALTKGIPEIASSSLTTIAGMVALMFMQFGIGMDLGRVLTKAIIFSMLSVFLFMPGLILMFERQIKKTMHKSFVPKIYLWGRFAIAARWVTIPVFVVVVAFAMVLSSKCSYLFDINSVESAKMNEYLTAKKAISEKFDMDNSMAIVVPKGDYESEAAILAEVEELPNVEAAMGLANITVDDEEEYVLTDALNPQELSQIADIDIDTVRLLYKFYAWKEEKYGAFLNSIDEFEIPLIDMVDFIYGEEQNGTFDFSDDLSGDIQDMHKSISQAREQLEGEEYARLLFTTSGPVEGEEAFETVDRVRGIAQKYYNEVYVVGDTTSDYDLSKSFLTDNIKISIMTALFVLIILFFTFHSYSLPVILVATIQSSIWINFSIPYLTDTGMFFLSYLVVSSIQMGATIDYAIVITSHYTELRQTFSDKRTAIILTLNQSFPTIITSGSILTLAAYVIGRLTSNPVIASLGSTLCKGTLTSIILVMLILPALLYIFDGLIRKTYRKKAAFGGEEAEK